MDKTEYLVIARKVLEKIAHNYVFAYYEVDDIIQEGLLIADAGYIKWDRIRPVEKFLFVILSSRLKSLYREKCCRSDSPCKICNNGGKCVKAVDGHAKCARHEKWQKTQNKRKNIVNMAAIKLNEKGETVDENFLTKKDVVTDYVETDDLNAVVRGRLTSEAQILFDKALIGVKLSKVNTKRLQEEVEAILEGMKIGRI